MDNNKSVTFLLPGFGFRPSGGFKVVFEYANRLIKDGYDVHIVFPSTIAIRNKSLSKKIRYFIKYIYGNIFRPIGSKWFPINKSIKKHITYSLNYRFMPKTTLYIATAVQTAYFLSDYKIKNTRKIYLIQDFENWGVSDEYVYNSYKLGLKNIVISNWLAHKVEESKSKYTIIKNGFDFSFFKLTVPIEKKDKMSVAMLYHSDDRKGCIYGIEALLIVKERFPDLKGIFFGVPPRPKNLPDWIEYYQQPDKETHNKIYNECAIYLAPSLQEGWGLTVGEAMICGAAIVCTNTLGFLEMVEDGESALISPIKNSSSLAKNIISLIENDDLRIKLAVSGNNTIKNFTWESSYKQMNSLFKHQVNQINQKKL